MDKKTDKIAKILECLAEKYADSKSMLIMYEPRVPEKLVKKLKEQKCK